MTIAVPSGAPSNELLKPKLDRQPRKPIQARRGVPTREILSVKPTS
jgi:hypothetical protein